MALELIVKESHGLYISLVHGAPGWVGRVRGRLCGMVGVEGGCGMLRDVREELEGYFRAQVL